MHAPFNKAAGDGSMGEAFTVESEARPHACQLPASLHPAHLGARVHE